MNNKEKVSSENRNSVRIPDSFIIKYNVITQKEYDKKAPLYISRRTLNRSTARRNEVEKFDFDWSHIEDEVDFDPVLVKILFYLDQKIDKVIANQDKILKKFDKVEEVQDESSAGECIDISGSGVSMLVSEELNPHALLELIIDPPINPPKQIILLGKLTRICQSNDNENKSFESSVTFTAINEDDREDLIKYIFQRQRELISSRKRSGNLSPDT
ncbi:type IV pilus assembly protein [Candidatus Scalindua japonica]|uniref:Type IV pilus assembly protein n=1 Tax=Candidatus Scalindua japonica TaxID=1284222 RepID=A0A286TWZ4_9BACT|nr:PilZ domain-containing protein [Candidatus Scalindua japonica]GAX60402.1 type IV pilus assembly protein [Candidatus Scalindua japonica]